MNTRKLPSPLAVCAMLVAIGLQVSWAQEYEVTDLGALGVTNTTWSVNSHGQVAGWSRLFDGHGRYHDEGFFYDGSTIDYIGTPGPTTRSDLLGVNDLGEAVGKSGTVHENGRALLRRTNGSVRRLGTLGGSRSAAISINNSSQVVGWSRLEGDAESHPFLWESGTMTALPILGGHGGRAVWINDTGQIVGLSTNETDGNQLYGVVWQDGAVMRLPPIHQGRCNIPDYVYNDGSIAGSVSIPGPQGGFIRRAAIWRDGEVDQVLGTLADGTPEEPFAMSTASAINASGVIVGISVDATGSTVPYVYQSGVMTRLDDLIPEPWIAISLGAGALNDAGQIAVTALGADGISHALLLTPAAPTAAAEGLGATFREDESGYYVATHGQRIRCGIPCRDLVTISLFDVTGRLVARPVHGVRSAGEHEIVWNGRTTSGRVAGSGLYIVRLATPGFTTSGRLTLVR